MIVLLSKFHRKTNLKALLPIVIWSPETKYFLKETFWRSELRCLKTTPFEQHWVTPAE
jgi:hypothetical protein